MNILMKALAVAAFALLLAVQYTLWFGGGGLVRVTQLKSMVAQQVHINGAQDEKNKLLAQHIVALRRDPQAIESLARTEVGMIKPGETLYRIVR